MENTGKRLQSLDALRGFDMFWIMGAPMIVNALYKLIGGEPLAWLDFQMEHAAWDGFRLMDIVFPLFLFIAGVSFPFSLEKRHEKKETESSIRLHVIKRALILVVLGLVYNGLLRYGFYDIRCASVLAHIGLAWFLAAIIYMNTTKKSLIKIWIAGIVIGYGLLNLLVLAPDATGSNPFLPENNIVAQFDRWFLPGRLYRGNFDPEGLLSLVPAIATALLGMTVSDYLRKGIEAPSTRKVLLISVSGVFLVGAALLSSLIIPINKALWSSSFMLLTGGISLLLLALFYWIIDVCHFTKWAFFFRVIGMNSIAIYMAQAIIDFDKVNTFFFGSIASLFPATVGMLILSFGYVGVCWLFLWFLFKKGIFIKV